MSFVKILLSVPDSAPTMNATYLNIPVAANQVSGVGMVNMISDMIDGAQLSYTKVSYNLVQATGTVTFSSIAAADTVTINGVTFTASASPSGANQFLVTGGDTLAAAALAAKINSATAPTGIINVVTATSNAAIITLTAVQPGLTGNAVTLAISAHGSVSAARMAGGTDGTQVAVNYGRAS